MSTRFTIRILKTAAWTVMAAARFTRTGRRWSAVLCVSVAVMSGGVCLAQIPAPQAQSIRVTDDTEVDASGNTSTRFEINCSPLVYNALMHLMAQRDVGQVDGKPVMIKERPSADAVIKYLGIDTGSGLVSDVQSEYDDPGTTIITSFKQRGHLTYRHRTWSMNVGIGVKPGIELRRAEVRGTTVRVEFLVNEPLLQMRVIRNIQFPAGTTDLEIDRETYTASAVMPPVVIPPEKATRKPTVAFDAKPELMTPLYKLYGQPSLVEFWAARTVFENTTADPLEDVRVRFKLDNMADWSPWEKADSVLPGQTWIIPYFPVLDASVMNIQNVSTTFCHMEFAYTTARGERTQDAESARIKVLGSREARYNSYGTSSKASFVETFRNAGPVFASFVTPNDPVVMDVLGVVARASAGKGYGQDDESSLRFLSTLYQFLRTNISYEQTAARSENGAFYQTLKFGRDVLRTRSGTCINLAILYASVCEAADLDVSLVLIPGHCFVKATLPSGRIVCVETTGCGGGTLETSTAFVPSQALANTAYLKHQGTAEFLEFRMRDLRQKGIWPPELPDLGPAPLTTWGINVPPPAAQESFVAADLLTGVMVACESTGIQVQLDPQKENGVGHAFVRIQQQQNDYWVVTFSINEASPANRFQPSCVVWSRLPLNVDAARRESFAQQFQPLVGGIPGELAYNDEGAPFWLAQLGVATRAIQSTDIVDTIRTAGAVLPQAVAAYLGSRNDNTGFPGSRSDAAASQTDRTVGATVQPVSDATSSAAESAADCRSLVGLWTTYFNDDDGDTSSATFRFESSGEMAYNTGNQRKGYAEHRGRFTCQADRLSYHMNGVEYATTIVWLGPDEFRMVDDDGFKLTFRRWKNER
jgi:hypothetical protein